MPESNTERDGAGRASSRAYLVGALMIQLVAGTLAGALDYLLVLEQRPERFSVLGWLTLIGTHAIMALTFRARTDRAPGASASRRRAGVIALAVGVLAGATFGLILAFIIALGPGALYRGHWDFG